MFSSQNGMREKTKEKPGCKVKKQDIVVKHMENDRINHEDRIICRLPHNILPLSLLHLFMNVLIRNKGRCDKLNLSSRFSSNNPRKDVAIKLQAIHLER